MARRLALAFLASASPVVLLLFFVPWRHAELVFALLVMAYPVALIAMAADRARGLGPLRAPLLLLLGYLEACAVGMYALRGQIVDGPWLAGLPLSAAILLYGLWLVPLLLVALVYGLSFDRFELPEEDLERLHHLTRDIEGEP